MKYRVPVRCEVQLAMSVTVQAANEEEAESIVEEMIRLERPPLNQDSVEEAMSEMREGRDSNKEWIVGICGIYEGITRDHENAIEAERPTTIRSGE